MQIHPQIAPKVTPLAALGLLLIGLGLVSWSAILGSVFIASRDPRAKE